jgi:formylglycine-generating enzyme required for sulfatase activity
MATKPPDAFLSYTRFDDRLGAIRAFRQWLGDIVREVSGEPFDIFQDIDDIDVGERWSGKLEQILDQARFFIPIMTPSYFKSEACRGELQKFLAAEKKAGREDLITPIYYIESPVLEDRALREADYVAKVLSSRQRYDWRELRHYSFRNRKVRLKIDELARQIDRARQRVAPGSAAAAPTAGVSQPTAKPAAPSQQFSPQQRGNVFSPKKSWLKEKARRDSVARSAMRSATLRARLFLPGKVFRDIDAPWCPELVVIPPGEFIMGSPEDEAARTDVEGPQHRVTFASPFALGKYPVTFEEYDHFCESTTAGKKSWDHGWGRGRRPVINVSLEDAETYCAWLSARTGRRHYRLPTEAEWEYACRAGTTTPFSTGAIITKGQATYLARRLGTQQVGMFKANPWGLHGMHGNVWEWCADCWNESYNGAPSDGSAWTNGDCRRRVIRGGSWSDKPEVLRSANRLGKPPESGNNVIGFRVARTLP